MTGGEEDPLVWDMYEAYRQDLAQALSHWWTSMAAVAATVPGTLERNRAAARLAVADRALSGAHPFLHRRHLQRLKQRLIPYGSAPPAVDALSIADLITAVDGALAEAEHASREEAVAVSRQLA